LIYSDDKLQAINKVGKKLLQKEKRKNGEMHCEFTQTIRSSTIAEHRHARRAREIFLWIKTYQYQHTQTPYTRPGHKVQNQPCWDASYTMELPKQKKVQL